MKTLFRVNFAKFVPFFFCFVHLPASFPFSLPYAIEWRGEDRAERGWRGRGESNTEVVGGMGSCYRAVKCLYSTRPLRCSRPRLETNQKTNRATQMPELTRHYDNNAHAYARPRSSQSAIWGHRRHLERHGRLFELGLWCLSFRVSAGWFICRLLLILYLD